MYEIDTTGPAYRRALGKRLRVLRDKSGMSQEDFGEFVGVPWRSYQNYETGAREPRSGALTTIAAKFDVRLEWLLFGDGHPFIRATPEAVQVLMASVVEHEESRKACLTHAQRTKVFGVLYRRLFEGSYVTDRDVDDLLDVTPSKERFAANSSS